LRANLPPFKARSAGSASLESLISGPESRNLVFLQPLQPSPNLRRIETKVFSELYVGDTLEASAASSFVHPGDGHFTDVRYLLDRQQCISCEVVSAI
jgi:hypothetical protein